MSLTREPSLVRLGMLPITLAGTLAVTLAVALGLSLACGDSASAPKDATGDDAAGGPAAASSTASGAESSDIEGGDSVADPLAEVPRFFNVTAESGLVWTHNHGGFGERWLPETLGPGVVLLDYNGDGQLDVLLVNGRNFSGKPGKATPPGLFRNSGGPGTGSSGFEGRFQDVTAAAGLGFSAWCLGGAAGDIDNDGDPDVYLTCLEGDRLLRNDAGRFTDVSVDAGIVQAYELGSSAAFFDADGDGWLDIYAGRYATWTPETDLFCGYDEQTKAYCTPELYSGLSSRYYRNRGDGTFEDRTVEAGLHNSDAKTLGVVPTDVDADGHVDLVVACDTYRNLLYHNLGDGTFEDIALASGIALSNAGSIRGGMGIASQDYDRNQGADLLITYFDQDMVGLYRNLGGGFFLDLGANSAVGRATRFTLGWGTFFFDYDLDGWLDVLVANGHLDDQVERFQPNARYAQAQQLFRNTDGDFREVTASAGGDLATPRIGRGAAFGDLDGDGDLDLVLTTNGGPAQVFENRIPDGASAHWLRLHLRGTQSNRDGLGAQVTVRAGSGEPPSEQRLEQSWYVHSGGSYLSQSAVSPTFGLGAHSQVDEVLVRWPSGVEQRLTAVAVDQELDVVEPVK